MHDDELVISPETVRELIADQFPQWRNLAVRAVDSQRTVNAIFRIGNGFAARFALRPDDAGLLRRTWSPRPAQHASWPDAPGSGRPSRWR